MCASNEKCPIPRDAAPWAAVKHQRGQDLKRNWKKSASPNDI